MYNIVFRGAIMFSDASAACRRCMGRLSFPRNGNDDENDLRSAKGLHAGKKCETMSKKKKKKIKRDHLDNTTTWSSVRVEGEWG